MLLFMVFRSEPSWIIWDLSHHFFSNRVMCDSINRSVPRRVELGKIVQAGPEWSEPQKAQKDQKSRKAQKGQIGQIAPIWAGRSGMRRAGQLWVDMGVLARSRLATTIIYYE